MKNKRLDLNNLQIKSFVTNIDSETEKTVKGGNHVTCPVCPTVNDVGCTFDQACFTVGEYCSNVQVC